VREKLGYSLKRRVIHPPEQERPRCTGKASRMKGQRWKNTQREVSVFGWKRSKHSFGTAIWSFGWQDAGSRCPSLQHTQNITILSAICLDGQFACTEYEGGTTKEHFLGYIKNTLLPEIHKGGYVVMDNLRTHHCKGVEELIRSVGAIPLYLPTYSPNLNPIEKMWSKMKANLRKLRIRVKKNLIPVVHQVLACVLPSDCEGWFCCAGYWTPFRKLL